MITLPGFLTGAAISAGVLLSTLAVVGKGPSEDEIRTAVISEIRANPQVIVETVNAYMAAEQDRQTRSADEKILGKKADIAAADGLPFAGNKDGSVTLVYFFDVNCVYCKRIDPVLKRIVAENSDVKLVHREIPILTQTSRFAAHLGNMVWDEHPSAYGELHDKFLAHEGALTADDIENYLRAVLGDQKATALLDRVDDENDEVVRTAHNRVQENIAVSRAAGITGTPFVFVLESDGLVRGAGENSYEQINDLIAKARSN